MQIFKPKRVFLVLFLSLIAAWSLKEAGTAFFLGGKTFSGRSFLGQVGILGVIFILVFGLFLLASNLWELFLVEYGDWLNRNLKLIGRQLFNQTQIYGWSFPVILGIVLLLVQVRIITFPYQLEYREGAIVLTTQALLRGINPYIVENNPLYINVYGLGLHLVAWPLAALLGNSLALHRTISAMFTFFQLILVMSVLRHEKTGWLFILLASGFIWIGQLDSTSPLARPDTMGEYLFLCSLFIPYLSCFRSSSIILGVALGIFGFYTKPYFILGVPILLTYLFLFVSKKKAVIAGVGAFAGLLISALMVNYLFEAYFFNTIFSHVADAIDSYPHLLEQIITFAQDYWSIFAVGLVAGGVFFQKANFQTTFSGLHLELRTFSGPLLPLQFNFFCYCLLIPTGLIYFSMGRHTGATQIYFYQLLTPFVVIIFFRWVETLDWQKGWIVLLVMINLFTHTIQNLKVDLNFTVSPGWAQLNQALSGRSNILNSPVSVSMLVANNQTIVDSGQTWYFWPMPASASLFYPDLGRLKQVENDFLNGIQADIAHQHYDLIMFDRRNQREISPELVQKYYKLERVIDLYLPHTSQTWKIELWIPQSP